MGFTANPFFNYILISSLTFGTEVYQSVRIFEPTAEKLSIIGSSGIPLDHVNFKRGVFIDLIMTKTDRGELIKKGIQSTILISDLTSYYKSRNTPSRSRNFPLGSMQGNYTWTELNNRFDELHLNYPNIISERIVIGQSVEGRNIWAFKVSDNPNQDEDEPKVLYTALTHAREPVGMMNLFYFVQKLAESYESDSELSYIIDNREMWFVPVVNPDGYIFNEIIEPAGGGMHRKNRLETSCGQGTGKGVDLNRNFGFDWGLNDIGSSPNPCDDTYRGDIQFSEPETQAIRDLQENYNFKNVLHYHTFSNLYIHSFGNGSLPEEPDLSTIRNIGTEMSTYNGYTVGNGLSTVGYSVNGDAVDWSYGQKNIISYTPEVGSYQQGFWPSENEILELCSLQFYPNKIFALVAGQDIILDSYQLSESDIMPGSEINLDLLLRNRGLENVNGNLIVEVDSQNDYLNIEQSSQEISSSIQSQELHHLIIPLTIAPNAPYGTRIDFSIKILGESIYQRSFVVNFLIGSRQEIFFDNFENGTLNWSLNGDWGLYQEAQTGNHVMTDSPAGQYQPGQETVVRLIQDIDLSYIDNPIIQYKAKWDIEDGWDFVRFQTLIQDVGWVTTAGIYTESGSGQPAQAFGEQGYDGTQSSWVTENIDLGQFDSSLIAGFRFIQTSDDFEEGDGFMFDDFSILGFPSGIVGDYNTDSFVDIIDILGIVDLFIFDSEPSQRQLFFCDLDRNGSINIMDLMALVDMVVGILD